MKPKMILFDAGRTLLDYANIDTLKGVKAIMPYIAENPRGLTAEEINNGTNEIFSRFEAARKQLFEVPAQMIYTLAYDLLNVKFSIPVEEIERILWGADAEKVPMPHAEELLDELNCRGIQTAVISNLDFSGYLLRETLDELFPRNRFRFVITSSDYGVRKPDRHIFEAGVAKSGLAAGDIWYVGDKAAVDVAGSEGVGMVPVLYQCHRNTYGELPEGLMTIRDHLELLDLIKV